MFDIGFPELLLVAIVMLLVLGPERLPEALRAAGLWLGRLRRSFTAVKTELEKEIGMDEVRRQLHNEAVLEEMKRIEKDVRGLTGDEAATPRPAPTDQVEAGAASAPGTPSETPTASAPREPAPGSSQSSGSSHG